MPECCRKSLSVSPFIFSMSTICELVHGVCMCVYVCVCERGCMGSFGVPHVPCSVPMSPVHGTGHIFTKKPDTFYKMEHILQN